ncbi:MAG: zinc permease [Flammeovirgaceae bacterium]|nr:zinc permease [Flammeovirgaceae bacterium]MBR08342.1 zinc permease [Rickettsiales bacterium]HCX24711.1 zinc permease [Cytophagales bacterium]
MLLIVLVLFGSAIIGGMAEKFVTYKSDGIRYSLIFAGSFLFSITIIHILPEIFSLGSNPMRLGLFILLGFFFQQLLEYFTSGIEHGHAHVHEHMSGFSKLGLVVALMLHSFLEGALLTHDSPFHEQNESYSLLIGIILHKVPAAFALTTTIKGGGKFSNQVWGILLLFSVASPIGLLLSQHVLELSSDHLLTLFAFVSGGFLHISTTIFVESSPNHHFGIRKFAVSLLGAAIAIATEFLV